MGEWVMWVVWAGCHRLLTRHSPCTLAVLLTAHAPAPPPPTPPPSTPPQAFADAQAGRLPDFPTIEMYFHTTVDPTLCDSEGRHSAALFVQW